jgi:hypothetical protein
MTDPNAETRRLLSELVNAAQRLDAALAAGQLPFLVVCAAALDVQRMTNQLRQHGDALQAAGGPQKGKTK